MKRAVLILVLGLAAAVAAYACVYHFCTASSRGLQETARPELAWLKDEFHLNDAEFQRVAGLHAGYLPQCAVFCRQIAVENNRLHSLLENATNATPEIDAALADTARLRAQCQQTMLRHFFDVSRTMPPAEGRRYLAWVTARTFPGAGMEGMP